MKKYKGLLFILPSLIGVTTFYIVPFILSFIYCFTEGVHKRKFVGLKNFIEILNNDAYKLAIYNTGVIVGFSLPLLLFLSIAVSFVIEKNVKKYNFLQSVFLIPMAIPVAALMIVYNDLLSINGIVNKILSVNVDYLKSDYAQIVIICIIVWKNLGYCVLIIINSLLTLPKEYEQAASLDGANIFQIAVFVKLPLIVPMLFFLFCISLFNCFKIFREIYILQGNYPYNSLYLLQHFMNNNFSKLSYEKLSVSAFILYIVIFLIIYILSKYQNRYINEVI